MSGPDPFQSSIAERYHEETRYSEAGLRREATSLPGPDPERQPFPFKRIEGKRLLLPSEGLPIRRPEGQVEELSPRGESEDLSLSLFSRLLFFTNGVTRMIRSAMGILHFRAAPSAGAMYPTEIYVAVGRVAGLAEGIYSYQLLDHSLVLVRGGDPFPTLCAASFRHPAFDAAHAAVILTAEWYRSTWRYRERGYRRCLLDTGHVLGNLVEVAPELGLAAIPTASFRDDLLEELLRLDPAEEGPLVLAGILTPEDAANLPSVPPRRSPTVEWRHAVAQFSDRFGEDEPERLVVAVHAAGRLTGDSEFVREPPPSAPSAPEGSVEVIADVEPTRFSHHRPVSQTILTRRSTRRFREAPVEKDPLCRALAHAVDHGPHVPFAPELLRTYLVAMDVVGLPPGCYLVSGAPLRFLELRRAKLDREMHHLGLEQAIFENAAAAIVHTVDLTRAVRGHGDRVYRTLGLDAGLIGQRLNLALLAEGIGVSGCGGYLDDQMNRVLRIPENQAVIYITVLGLPSDAVTGEA